MKNKRISVLRQNKGQIILEYILILVIAVSVATLLTSRLVGRGDDSSGIVIQAWGELNRMVGEDLGD